MEFKVKRTSDYFSTEPTIKHINTLEELLAFQEEVGAPLIIVGLENKIEIYDDYRE